MKVVYEKQYIDVAIKALNEISVTGIMNAQNLTIIAGMLEKGEILSEQEEEKEGGKEHGDQ